ncbi:hypothetical protein LTR91_021143 [Friedmanniomyces endolithicus]|uniref:FAD dependent oxidoreductase domain-containing protein n=1 Tax=Friedmanniomyces endolithicus TaxID=329885 RepID=A0A4U0UTG5_9PEZI|nr:hypothetical protein LTS09_010191 [Friedmanniomyces endolithicus]KAK0366753.1 hypothetical protein LTR94_001512 [Friedmanniomyces endolithicus]KAK0772270.1 hypothetical protein LTR38_016950 [Friedmanniomyces endolithicus]KAK0778180.1 hypothetical protein LTR75_015729 [Friedmanniomyces endolithicus]KAK0810343.1 hypothetical protein LTR59_002336 [Friedmanniomyces endolithicus]
MEERARVPPGLPRSHPTVSYWQDPPADIADLRTTAELPAKADYVVVGSGISGSFIAYNILCKQPEASVVILEARQAASGATGRNGGHTKAASYRSFVDHEKELGLDEAKRIARLEYANIVATHDFARKHGIRCDSNSCDTVDIIYSQTHLDAGNEAIRRMRETMGEDDPAAHYRVFIAAEARKTFRTPSALGAFQYAAGSLSAYAFTIGVLKLALSKGLNLQTTTPAESITSTDKSSRTIWSVQTPRGCIETPSLTLATNGYTAHLVPQMQGLIVPLHGQVVAQRPGLGMPQTGLPNTYSFIHETGYEYMITRPPLTPDEGTIIIGGGLWQLPNSGASRYGETDDTALEPTVTKYLRDCTPGFFGSENWGPDDPSGRTRKEWSGIMGASADGLPYVGAMPDMPGLWISAAFNGHGMVWCLKAAEALVGMMMGDEGERRAVDGWFPRSARMSRERMGRRFMGRKDLRAPGEGGFGERGRL